MFEVYLIVIACELLLYIILVLSFDEIVVHPHGVVAYY